MDDAQSSERRKNGGLTDDQIEAIKDAVLASVYEDIGRSLVKKALWAIGAILAGFLGFVGADHIFFR